MGPKSLQNKEVGPFRLRCYDLNDFAFENLSIKEHPRFQNTFSDAHSNPWDTQLISAVALIIRFNQSNPELSEALLVQKNRKMRSHAGQIALPGGKIDPGDAGIIDGLHREIKEEISVDHSKLQMIGWMDYYMSLKGLFVVPFVMQMNWDVPFAKSDDEIHEIFNVPLKNLTSSSSKPFQFNIYGMWRQSHRFIIDGPDVWGLTARIIYDMNIGLKT